MRDLKALGLSNVLLARRKSFTHPALIARAAAHYAEHYSDPDRRIRATFVKGRRYLDVIASAQRPTLPGLVLDEDAAPIACACTD